MSDMQVQPVGETPAAGQRLSQMQRVMNVFIAPSKTFQDIRDHSRSWWLPFLIIVVTGAFLYTAVTLNVTWKGVYENQQRAMPEFAKRMMENMPPEQRAAAEQKGPINQEVTWALSPIGLLLINLMVALILWPTINFGFGGKAKFSSVLAVTMYAAMVLWPIKLLLGGVALLVGAEPAAFDPSNVAGTNIAYYLEQRSGPLYVLAKSLDPLDIWCMVLTSIGVAIIAGTKRPAGYITVFGWWALIVLLFTGVAAAFS